MEKTSRETLREWGFEDHVLEQLTDEECAEHMEAIIMYPEG